MSQLLEDLTAARALVADLPNWLRIGPAMDTQGRWVSPLDINAIRFDMAATCMRVAEIEDGFLDEQRELNALTALNRQVIALYGIKGVCTFSDDMRISHDDVLRVFDAAIAAEREASRS